MGAVLPRMNFALDYVGPPNFAERHSLLFAFVVDYKGFFFSS